MKVLNTLAILTCLVLFLGGEMPARAASYKIIVHRDNVVTQMTSKEVSNLFLKKVTRWPNGESVEPLDLIEESPVRETFSKDIHGRKVLSIKAYWQKQIFSGRKVPPAEKKSDAEVLSFVQNNPGAIGYISSDSRIPADIKVIQVR